MTHTWMKSSPTRPRPTTALSLTDWNPPPTMWTFTLAHGGLRTGQSSTPAPLTPGYKVWRALLLISRVWGCGTGFIFTWRVHKNWEPFHELWLSKCVCCKVNVCFGGEFSWAMADGKTGMCAKEGNQGMFLISYFIFILVEEDGIWLGWGVCWGTMAYTGVRRHTYCSV